MSSSTSDDQQRGRKASPKRLVSSASGSRAGSAAPTPVNEVPPSLGQEGNDAPTASDERVKVKLVERVTTEWTRPAATRPQERPSRTARGPNTISNDPSSSEAPPIAAAEYPWLYMSSTLDACFQNDSPATSTLPSTKLAIETSGDDSNAEASTSQSNPEKLRFVDEGSDTFAKNAPAIMQAFHTHGEACSLVEAEALKLALQGPESNHTDEEDDGYDDDAKLQVYRDMLEKLDKLHTEALSLESSLVELTESFPSATTTSSTTNASDKLASPEPASEDITSEATNDTPQDPKTGDKENEPTARSQILSLISASLPVIRARIMNISMAQELVDSALENCGKYALDTQVDWTYFSSSPHTARLNARAFNCVRHLQVQAGNAEKEAFLAPVESHPGVWGLALNRPKSKNAISVKLLEQLRDCLETVKYDKSVRTLILHSTTVGSFCAGADLIERRTMSQVQVNKFLSDLRDALGKLEALPMPTIAAIDGPALGGGLEISLACDLRVAGHNVTKIGLPETGLGIIPGAGGTQRATRLLGPSRAKDLIFTARSLNAQEALEWGLVNYVSAPESTAFDRALSLAEQITRNAPLALRAAKQAISRSDDLALETGLDFERATYETLLKTQDRLEALAAFKEKRRPNFQGE
ncbi:hypothetical protein NMY22_g7282 [Coprinellus aureogranulatus]|nr:hypothetical protein NMY22_g7282 [Coprinellus aureogranulatus]